MDRWMNDQAGSTYMGCVHGNAGELGECEIKYKV